MAEPAVDVRAAFEHWFSEGKYPFAIERRGGGYKLAQAQSAWVAWQAAWASRDADVSELIEDRARLEWFVADVAKGDDGAGLYFDGECWGAPYLVSNAGGSGGGVGEFRSPNFREAIDFFRVEVGS